MTAESSSAKVIVLGTRNKKKLAELVQLLGPHGFTLRTLDEFPDSIEVEETGHSFADNAALKATQQAMQLGQWVVGEDSGLSVDALHGAPGVYSARFSGPGATDQRNNEKLLHELRDVPLDKRTAYYVCHMSLADPRGNVRVACEDYCRGRIRFEAAGTGGFGYDPLFEIPEYHQTFGELSPAVKGVLSHRSRAVRTFVRELLALLKREPRAFERTSLVGQESKK